MKTAISLPDDLFERIDRAAADSGMSRSAFFVAAAEAFLKQQEAEDVTSRINEVIARAGNVTEPWVLRAGLETLAKSPW